MAAIAWWTIPIVATLLAAGWVAWAGRSRGAGDVSDTTRHYAKFRAAMERPSVTLPDEPARVPRPRARRGGSTRLDQSPHS